ncbi:hypothetical protein ACFLZY_00805 [Patescibacteria group bacterium]
MLCRFVVVVVLASLSSVVASATVCGDKACRAEVADLIDRGTEIVALAADRAVIGKIKSALKRADLLELTRVLHNLRKNAEWKIQNKKVRQTWYKIVFVATNFAATRSCEQRNFWFLVYTDTWTTKKDVRLFDEAQSYLRVRYDNKYACE